MVGPKESYVEDYLVSSIEGVGGECLKLEVKGRRGWPDRICIVQDKVFFVECKRPKSGRLSALQRHRIEKLCGLGASVYVINTRQQIRKLLKEITK